MTKKWEDMTVEEKLDWLRDRVNEAANVDGVNQALGSVHRKIEKVSKDLEQLRKRIEPGG